MNHKHSRWFILLIVSSALFMIVMDMTILYTALPTLSTELNATATESLWIVNAYPLVMAGLLLTMGRLCDKLGHNKMFNIGLVIFGIASLIAAFSPTPAVLIIGRILLAVGASMMMPATLSIIRITFQDKKERAFAIGVWSSIASAGAGVGPLVGGLLLERFWWGSVFLINVPIVIIAVIVSLLMIPASKVNKHIDWDPIGSIQILIGLTTLVYGIKEFGKSDGLFIGLIYMFISIITISIFIKRQRKLTTPLLDVTLFKDKAFTTGAITAVLVTFVLIGTQLIFTQQLQLVEGRTPLQAGLYLMAIAGGSFIAGVVIGSILDKIEKNVHWVSLLISAAGLLGYIFIYNQNSLLLEISCLFIVGAGLGSAMTAASNSIMANAPVEKAGMAASFEEVSFELGGAIGVAILGSMLTASYTSNLVLPEGVDVSQEARESLASTLRAGESTTSETAQAIEVLAKQAFNQSFETILLITAGILVSVSVLIFIYQFMSRSKKKPSTN